MHIHYIYARGLLYMPPRVLALWGQNPAGTIMVEQPVQHFYWPENAIDWAEPG